MSVIRLVCRMELFIQSGAGSSIIRLVCQVVLFIPFSTGMYFQIIHFGTGGMSGNWYTIKSY